MTTWIGPAAIAATSIIMLLWTWGAWPDVLVDFGRELYVPWQLSQGKVLHRDIAFFHGTLSQYVNSLWFSLFGVSLRTLVVCNLALLGLLILMLHYACREIGSRVSATAACLAFVLLFAFTQFTLAGNFNYVCPYSHETTHGLLLSLAALICVWQYRRLGSMAVAISGLAVGLALLTKPEVFLAGMAATVSGLFLTLWVERCNWRRVLVSVACFMGAASAPPAVALACFSRVMPPGQALRGIMNSWAVMTNVQYRHLPFYRIGMGTDDVCGNLFRLLTTAGVYAAFVVPAALIALSLRKPGGYRVAIAAALSAATGYLAFRFNLDWLDVARPLPLFMLAAGIGLFASLVRHRRDSRTAQRLIRQVSFTVLSFVLLGKVILNARIYQYGFVLAMPATLVLVTALLNWIPAWVNRHGGAGLVVSGAALVLMASAVVVYLTIQAQVLSTKQHVVGEGADAFRTDFRGAYFNAAIRQVRARSTADRTLAVLPEGVMLNYLCRRRNPTPYVDLILSELVLFGEDRVTASFQACPPDIIVLTHRDTSEFGLEGFGRGYGRRLSEWIARNYRAMAPGVLPPPNAQFGMMLMQRIR